MTTVMMFIHYSGQSNTKLLYCDMPTTSRVISTNYIPTTKFALFSLKRLNDYSTLSRNATKLPFTPSSNGING